MTTQSQAESDRIWDALFADGGEARYCGWPVVQLGVSWQVFQGALATMLRAPDREAAYRVQEPMMDSGEIDIAKMQVVIRTHQ